MGHHPIVEAKFLAALTRNATGHGTARTRGARLFIRQVHGSGRVADRGARRGDDARGLRVRLELDAHAAPRALARFQQHGDRVPSAYRVSRGRQVLAEASRLAAFDAVDRFAVQPRDVFVNRPAALVVPEAPATGTVTRACARARRTPFPPFLLPRARSWLTAGSETSSPNGRNRS